MEKAPLRHKADQEPLLLALLGATLFLLPWVSDDGLLAKIAFFLLLGLPMLVGVLVRSPTVVAVPMLVGALLILSPFLGLGEDSELWSDGLSGLAVIIMTFLQMASAAIGASVGHLLARRRARR